MILNSPYISGSLTVTANGTVSGSLTVLGGITGAITGSATSASYAVSASEASTLQGLGSSSFAPAATFNIVSQSYAASSASLSTRVTNEEATSSVLTSASASFATTSGSISSRVTLIEGQYATTGSNNFTAPQQISNTSNAISFTSTASLYTEGGLRVKGSSFISGTAYFNDVVVYGTSSIEYITSSQIAIGTNIITLNTDTPSVRFGGISVFDSGSNNLSTGSLFWDSEKDKWIYSNPSASTYDGGMLISGPRNTSGLGNEVGTTSCAVMIGQGGDHITSSAIFSYGNATCFYGQSYISSSGAACFNNSVLVTGNAATNAAIVTNNSGGAGGTAQYYVDFTAAATVIGRILRGNGASGYEANGLNVDNYAGMQIKLNALGGSGGTLTVTGGAACFTCNVGATGAFTSTGTTTNSLGFVTTNTSASKTHRAYTDSSGNYIIYDATSDSNRFTIASTGAATFVCNVTAGSLYARSASDNEFINIGQSTSTAKQLLIGSTYASNVFYVQGIQQNVGYNQNISLQPSGGNVGIGCISPGMPLTVNGAISAARLYTGNSGISMSSYGSLSQTVSGQMTVLGHNLISDQSAANTVTVINGGWYSSMIRLYYNEGINFHTSTTVYNANDVYPQNTTLRMRVNLDGTILIGGTSQLGSALLSTFGSIAARNSGVDGTYAEAFTAYYSSNNTESNAILTAVSSNGTQSGFKFDVSNGAGSAARTTSLTVNRGSVTVAGSLSKGSGSFRIKHPLVSKKDTHQLVHSFIEGPQADLIYRGKIALVNGRAIVNIDEAAGMTEGTFEALCRDVQCFTSNETSWDAVRGKVEGSILTIECQNTESTDEISWLVIGERQDEHMMDTEWTDENGKVIVEPLITE